MRLKDEPRPIFRRDLGKLGKPQRLRIRSIEGIGQRLLQAGDLGELGMARKRRIPLKVFRNVTAEIPHAALIGRVGGNIRI